MNLSKNVSPELAKELHDLGLRVETEKLETILPEVIQHEGFRYEFYKEAGRAGLCTIGYVDWEYSDYGHRIGTQIHKCDEREEALGLLIKWGVENNESFRQQLIDKGVLNAV